MAQNGTAQSIARSVETHSMEHKPVQRGLSAVEAGFFWVLLLVAAASLVYFTVLDATALLLLLVPAVLSAIVFNRLFYLFAVLSSAGTEAAITLLEQTSIDRSVILLGLTIPVALIMSEIIYRVIQRHRKLVSTLRSTETLLRCSIEQSSDGILLVDENGTLVAWNRSMESISGIARLEALERPYWDLAYKLLPEDMRSRNSYEKIKNEMKLLLQNGRVFGDRLPDAREISRPDMTRRWVRELVFPIQTEKGCAAGSIVRDVSADLAAELERKTCAENLTLSLAELRERDQDAALLDEMEGLLQSCLSVADACDVVNQFAARILRDHPGIIYVFNDRMNLFEARMAWGRPVGDGSAFRVDECWALRRGRPHLVSETENKLVCQHIGTPKNAPNPSPYACIPLTSQGETLGVFHIQARPGQEVEKLAAKSSPVAARLAQVLMNLRLREALRMEAIRDPLTDLFNRRYMEETMERELHRAARRRKPLGFLEIDIDQFDRFNKRFGCDAGKAFLAELGAFLRANIRSEDVACRYDAQKFVLIFPEASLEDTCKRAHQLREGLAGMKLQRRGQSIGPVTVSQGISGFPDHGASAAQILQAAETALSHAKRGGGDRVVVAEI